jgi:hypothetical protein
VIVEITILRAQNIGFAALGGLQDDQIAWIAQLSAIVCIQNHEVRHALEKLRVFEQIAFRKEKERLKSGYRSTLVASASISLERTSRCPRFSSSAKSCRA